MSAFEISVTPTRFKGKKRAESREPTDVVMAPFSAKAIVQFEDVPVTKTAKRILNIINPSDEDIEVKVSRTPNAEHKITIDWTENVVPAHNEIPMEMVWSPQIEIACKETLQLLDNRNFRKDVMVILKSKSNSMPKNTKKYPSVGKTLHLKSPTGGIKTNKTSTMQQRKRATKPAVNAAAASGNKLPWRNVATQRVSSVKKDSRDSVTHNNVKATHQQPLTERNVYLDMKFDKLLVSPEIKSGCKENISPMTPGNVISIIDKMNFTPATEPQNKSLAIENLASWPTPVERDYAGIPFTGVNSNSDLRPRRLTAGVLVEVEEDALTSISQVITNKTFDVKHSESLDISNDSLDSSRADGPISTLTLNKTTTITNSTQTRHLDVIREEDVSSPPSPTKSIEKQSDLKRDIKLVGTPLRKYSESMRDLSLLSPQSKLAIQGSMPNLNEMEQIRSIEQNRYFQQQTEQKHHLKTHPVPPVQSLNSSTASEISLISHNELMFNQSEILAQSSRFNLHEVGMKSRKNSPVSNKGLHHPATHKGTSPKASKTTNHSKLTIATHKRRSHELSFSDSPSTESLIGEAATPLYGTKSAPGVIQISPPKRQRIESFDNSLLRNAPANASAPRVRNWSQTQPKKFKLSQTLSLVKKPITPRKTREPQRVKLYDSDLYLQCYINPDPFAATTTADPFLASTMYLDERAVDRHQDDFKKWLNALVSIPADLDADCNSKIDVGKLFNEVRNKELTLAPTKEEQSMNYLTKFRLESLRRAAVALFFSEEMRHPCSKVAVYVNKQALRIRSDRNLHLDVVMQRYILELLLCFNPIWLRLGLEVVYGEKIHLQSNRDIIGLSTFILNRLFRNKFEEQKFSKAFTLSDEYSEYIKKFTLQKMLFLLLFLDKAKEKRIIKHNPCLFVKKSPHKETKDILLRFASELLANIGDITRDLKRLGYVLQHKQNFLDEFDYAFNNLAVDLRDGIRLTRVMEIILLRDDLTKQLRVPAISRLQRIFNVNLALRALSSADFQLNGEITAADIVDGHREKTLSLLWQLIYKFRSPKFHAAARVLQDWWRRSWLRVVIRRRIKHKELLRRERAITVVQAFYRGYQTRKYVKIYRDERIQAATVLQKYVRRYLAQKYLYHAFTSIIRIQQWIRAQRMGYLCRQKYIRLRDSVIFLQRIWRRRVFARKLLQAAETIRLQLAQRAQAAAMCIQIHWRAYQLGRQMRERYLRQRKLIIFVQQKMRAKWAMRKQQGSFIQLKNAVVSVQQLYRAKREMRVQQTAYLETRQTIIKLQKRWRAKQKMLQIHKEYLVARRSIVFVQQRMRAKWLMRSQRHEYLQIRQAAIIIQRKYRGRLLMKQQVSAYQRMRTLIVRVQHKWRATLLMRQMRMQYLSLVSYTIQLQRKFRATKLMQQKRSEFVRLCSAVICVQRRFRAKLMARQLQTKFCSLKNAALIIQRRYRAYKCMRFHRAKFRGTQAAVACLQTHIRGYLLMKRIRAEFHKKRAAAILLQRAFRRHQLMLKERASYLKLKAATIYVQQKLRATIDMRSQRACFTKQRQLVIAMQRRFRAKLLAREIRCWYANTLSIILHIQTCYRAKLAMRQCRNEFLATREKIIVLQQRFRAQLAMKHARTDYQRKVKATILLQRWYRGLMETRRQQNDFQRKRTSSLVIQRKWRATLAARTQRSFFRSTVSKICCIQRTWRALLQMRADRQSYQTQRRAAIVLQSRYRARLAMLGLRSQYLLIQSLVICIQRKFRAKRAMLLARSNYLLLRRTTIHLQQKHRGRQLMGVQRAHFLLLRSSIVSFQAHARGFLARKRFQALMTPEMVDFLRQKKAAKVIQRYWRGYCTRKRFRNVAILAIRNRVIKLRDTSIAANSVRSKVQEAVRFLRGRFIASDAISVLNRLDRLSRTVPHLLTWCSEFMSTFCYGIMAQAIRSEVDKQLIECCSRIILNLARYNCSTVNTFQKGGLVTIAQMLFRWCDKDCEIFNTLCTLIWVFAHCPKKRQIIRDFMTTTDAIYLVRETKKLVARKEKMKQNARKPASQAGRKTQHQQNFSTRALPSLEPDFGIIRYSPYTFISSVYAFDTILCKLGIELY